MTPCPPPPLSCRFEPVRSRTCHRPTVLEAIELTDAPPDVLRAIRNHLVREREREEERERVSE